MASSGSIVFHSHCLCSSAEEQKYFLGMAKVNKYLVFGLHLPACTWCLTLSCVLQEQPMHMHLYMPSSLQGLLLTAVNALLEMKTQRVIESIRCEFPVSPLYSVQV